MTITRDDVKSLRAANQRKLTGGKIIYIRTPRNGNLIDLLEFIEANYPEVFAEAPAPAPEAPATATAGG